MTRVALCVEQLRQRIPGGIGTYIRGLVMGLDALGEPHLALECFASKGTLPDALDDLPFPLTTSALGHRAQLIAWNRGIGGAPRDADLVHLCSLAGPVKTKSLTTAMIHDVSWRKFPELTTPRGRRWHERQLTTLLNTAATLIVPSERVRDDLVANGVTSSRIAVIGEGADHLPDPDHQEAERLLRAHHIEDEFILCVATLEPRKNLDRLVKAHALATTQGLTLPLVIIGPQGWGPEVRQGSALVIEGYVSPSILAGLYAAATAMAYVPIEEGFGLPPLEALWQGTPVLASTATPSVQDAKGVIVVDPFDTDAIALGLHRVTEHASERGVQGKEFAQDKTWKAVAQRHVDRWRMMQ